MNLSFQKNNTYVLQSCPKDKISFSGDKNVLKPFFDFGIANKKEMIADTLSIKRPEIDEEVIINLLIDPDNKKPALITGTPQAGKSVVAGRIIKTLTQQGHNVIKIENDIVDRTEVFGQKELQELIKKIDQMGESEKVFVFIDEPQFVPRIEEETNPGIDKAPENSIMGKLSRYIEDNDKVKLVGIMYDEGFYDNSYTQNMLLRALFPKENHITIPDMKLNEKITIINSILNKAGFKEVPEDIKKRMPDCKSSIKIRDLLKIIYDDLRYNKDRTDDVSTPEAISDRVWTFVLKEFHYPSYLYLREKKDD